MQRNMGKIDKVVRISLALIVAALYFTDVISGTVALVFVYISGMMFLTSMISFCPLYATFGLTTCTRAKSKV